jgi:pilus assembly protein CpaE
MRLIVAGEDESTTASLRHWLVENNLATDARHFPLVNVADRAARYRPHGVLLCLPQHPEEALPLVRELHETLQTRVLVVGPAAEAKLILRLLREGAFQYIDQDEFETELPVAIQRFDASSPADHDFGRLITVVSAGGGTGASTVAANVATGLAARHDRCALVDLRLHAGDLATLLDLQPAHDLADFCRNSSRMNAELFSRCLSAHSSGVRLLAAPGSYHERGLVTPRAVRKAIGMARSRFRYVVVDLDSPYQPEQSQAVLQSDVLLVVIRMDFPSVRQAQQLLMLLDELEVDRQQIHLVAGRYGRAKELKVKDVEATLGLQIRYFVPDDSRSVNRANNRGIPVVLDSPRATISRKLMDISQSVNGYPTN